MKKYLYFIMLCISSILWSCEKADIEDSPNYDKTEILNFNIYDTNKKSILVRDAIIDSETGTIQATVSGNSDFSKLFATCTLSPGSTIYPSIAGYQDWSSKSKEFKVVSASGSRDKQWTITLIIKK